MIVYGSVVSPFVRKLLGYLGEKGIDFELRGVGIGDPDPGFQAASPLGKMPAMDVDGFLLADPSPLTHYLEPQHPEPPRIPPDPQAPHRTHCGTEFATPTFRLRIAKFTFNRP